MQTLILFKLIRKNVNIENDVHHFMAKVNRLFTKYKLTLNNAKTNICVSYCGLYVILEL